MWIHVVFSLTLCVLLAGMVLFKRNLPTLFVAGMMMLYLAGNTYIHIKRGDFRRDTLYEYTLLSLAVFVVLMSAIT